MTALPLRSAFAALAVGTLLLAACGDDDDTPNPGVENQEEVDAGDGSGTTVQAPSGGVGSTGGNSGQGNVEPDSPDDTTQQTAQGTGG